MTRAFSDIALSTFAVFISLFLAHFIMRQNGLARPIETPPSGWWSGKFLVAQEYEPSNFGLEQSRSLQTTYGNLGVEVIPQVTITNEELAPRLKLVRELLHDSKNRILVNILAYQTQIDKQVIKAIAGEKAEERVIIRSPYDNTVREILRQKPKWNLSSGEGETSRFYILTSLALEAFPPLTGTFYFFNLVRHPHDFSSRLLTELRRRQLTVLVETPDDASAWEKALAEGVNGVVTPSAEHFLAWYKRLP